MKGGQMDKNIPWWETEEIANKVANLLSKGIDSRTEIVNQIGYRYSECMWAYEEYYKLH